MPTHKITNEFIRKYNKQFAIKGYSKMSVSEKVKTIQNYVGKPGMSGMKRDWKAIMDKYPGYSGSAAKAPPKNTRTRKLRQSTLDTSLPKHAARANKLAVAASYGKPNWARPAAPKKRTTYLLRG
jgi:hypothetical protein